MFRRRNSVLCVSVARWLGAASLCLLLPVAGVAAHSSLIATHFLTKSNGPDGEQWHLSMNFAQAALDAAVLKVHGDAVQSKPVQEYVALVHDYVKSSVHVETIDGAALRLENFQGKVGGHATVFSVDLAGMPPGTEMLRVRIGAGAENEGHANLLRTDVNGGEKRYWMRVGNDFTVRVRIAGVPYGNLLIIGGMLLVLAVIGGTVALALVVSGSFCT